MIDRNITGESVPDAVFRMHVYSEIDAVKKRQDTIADRQMKMDEKLDELLVILRASKIGAGVIRWSAAIVLAIAGTYAAFKGIKA